MRPFENIRVFLCLVNIKESFLKSRQWSRLCAHLCFLLLGQRHPGIRCSSEASHGCTSSKRVQLSWKNFWQLISDLAVRHCTSLSPVSSFALTSHNVTPAFFSIHSQKKCERVSKFSATEAIYKAWQTEPRKGFSVLFKYQSYRKCKPWRITPRFLQFDDWNYQVINFSLKLTGHAKKVT